MPVTRALSKAQNKKAHREIDLHYERVGTFVDSLGNCLEVATKFLPLNARVDIVMPRGASLDHEYAMDTTITPFQGILDIHRIFNQTVHGKREVKRRVRTHAKRS